MRDIGARLKETRVGKGFTRKELAKAISPTMGRSVNPQTIVKLENGTMRVSTEWLDAISKALDVPPAHFFNNDNGQRATAAYVTEGKPVPVFTRDAVDMLPDVASIPKSKKKGEVLTQEAGKVVAFEAVREDIDRLCPDGSSVLIKIGEVKLEPGRRYLIKYDDRFVVRKYGVNPERWEPESLRDLSTIFPHAAVTVIGQALGCFTQLD